MQIHLSERMYTHARAAVSANPTAGFAWHVLGRWHFEVHQLGLLQRAAMVACGAWACTGASMSEARKAFEKAAALEPSRLEHQVELAKVRAVLRTANLIWKPSLSTVSTHVLSCADARLVPSSCAQLCASPVWTLTKVLNHMGDHSNALQVLRTGLELAPLDVNAHNEANYGRAELLPQLKASLQGPG